LGFFASLAVGKDALGTTAAGQVQWPGFDNADSRSLSAWHALRIAAMQQMANMDDAARWTLAAGMVSQLALAVVAYKSGVSAGS
jgi:hypothetical protein